MDAKILNYTNFYKYKVLFNLFFLYHVKIITAKLPLPTFRGKLFKPSPALEEVICPHMSEDHSLLYHAKFVLNFVNCLRESNPAEMLAPVMETLPRLFNLF